MSIVDKVLSTVGLQRKRTGGNMLGITNAGNPVVLSSGGGDTLRNAYGQIDRIASAFAIIEPVHIDTNLKEVKHSSLLDAFFVPNTDMDGYQFRRGLAMLHLLKDEYYVRVLHSSKNVANGIDPKKITGFEIIDATPIRHDGKTTYQTVSGMQIDEVEVMAFRQFNPKSYKKGYSAMQAVRGWAELNDYIIDYESGFFENGAIPAGQFIITAPDKDVFFAMRSALEERHRGAGNNNGVAYTWRKETMDGKGQPQIEWVPFNVSNRDLNITELLEANNKMIDRTLGVPAEIMGFLQNSNYASVGTARQVFTEYCVRPVVQSIYSRFNHELSRICDGKAGVLDATVDIPMTEEEKLRRAESKKVEVETIKLLVADGYTYESAYQAVKNNDYTLLAADSSRVTTEDADKENDIDNDADAHSEPPVEVSKSVARKTIDDIDRAMYEYKVEDLTIEAMTATVDITIAKLDEAHRNAEDGEYGFTEETAETTEEEDDTMDAALAGALGLTLTSLIVGQGEREIAAGRSLLVKNGVDTAGVPHNFVMTGQSKRELDDYLKKIATDFNATTQHNVRRIISNGITNQLPYETIRDQLLNEGVPRYRAVRLAATEVNRASNRAAMVAMQNIQEALNDREGVKYQIYKTPRSKTGSPCSLCVAHIGKKVPVDDYYWKVGEEIIGTDGKPYVNSFVNAEVSGFHPNCHCEDVYTVEAVE